MKSSYSTFQLIALTLLRVLIGWHFLFEGLVKLYDPSWSARPYLLGASGPFAGFFKNLARNDVLLPLIDFLNEWGLVVVGLCLFSGLISKPAKVLGIILLSFYYFSYPPFSDYATTGHVEGTYWIVNKNLIEMAAILVLYMFPTSKVTGLDRFLFHKVPVHYENHEELIINK